MHVYFVVQTLQKLNILVIEIAEIVNRSAIHSH